MSAPQPTEAGDRNRRQGRLARSRAEDSEASKTETIHSKLLLCKLDRISYTLTVKLPLLAVQ